MSVHFNNIRLVSETQTNLILPKETAFDNYLLTAEYANRLLEYEPSVPLVLMPDSTLYLARIAHVDDRRLLGLYLHPAPTPADPFSRWLDLTDLDITMKQSILEAALYPWALVKLHLNNGQVACVHVLKKPVAPVGQPFFAPFVSTREATPEEQQYLSKVRLDVKEGLLSVLEADQILKQFHQASVGADTVLLPEGYLYLSELYVVEDGGLIAGYWTFKDGKPIAMAYRVLNQSVPVALLERIEYARTAKVKQLALKIDQGAVVDILVGEVSLSPLEQARVEKHAKLIPVLSEIHRRIQEDKQHPDWNPLFSWATYTGMLGSITSKIVGDATKPKIEVEISGIVKDAETGLHVEYDTTKPRLCDLIEFYDPISKTYVSPIHMDPKQLAAYGLVVNLPTDSPHFRTFMTLSTQYEILGFSFKYD